MDVSIGVSLVTETSNWFVTDLDQGMVYLLVYSIVLAYIESTLDVCRGKATKED